MRIGLCPILGSTGRGGSLFRALSHLRKPGGHDAEGTLFGVAGAGPQGCGRSRILDHRGGKEMNE